MSTYDWSHVELTIGGQKIPGPFTVGVDPARGEDHAAVSVIAGDRLVYSATCAVDMPANAWADLQELFTPKRRGASDATLQRRVGYGGRKGRRAFQRLLGRGCAVWRTVGDHVELTMRGRMSIARFRP